MLSQRVIRASALRSGIAAARRLPIVQRRTFLPSEYTDRKTLDAKYPDPTRLSAAQDPDMNGGYINPQPSSASTVIPMPTGGTLRSEGILERLSMKTTTSSVSSRLGTTPGLPPGPVSS
uniref:Uncharacterized protein n=1 Tax=Bionectria ochroleuca TaxID=29856 RepID=A0A8H7K7Q7_BIOOC